MFSGGRGEPDFIDRPRSTASTLPPELAAKVHEFRQRWLSVGQSTQPTDWYRAFRALSTIYEDAGGASPYMVRCASPWQLCVMPTVLKSLPQFESQLSWPQQRINEKFGSLKSQLDEQLRRQIKQELFDELRFELEVWLEHRLSRQLNLLSLQLDNYIHSKIRSQNSLQNCPEFGWEYWTGLWSKLDTQCQSNLGIPLSSQIRAQIEAQEIDQSALVNRHEWYAVHFMLSSLALHSFARSCFGVIYDERVSRRLDLWLELAETVHGFLPFDDVCFVSERPTRLLSDGTRFHCPDGPALAYPDSYSLYAWHGVLIEHYKALSIICRPKTITYTSINDEPNQELKRVMLDRYGIPRYLLDSESELIHEDEFGKLYKTKLQNTNIELTGVVVENSTTEPDGTTKTYFIPVHPDLRPLPAEDDGELGAPQPLTARNAVASTFGLRGDEFWPLIET